MGGIRTLVGGIDHHSNRVSGAFPLKASDKPGFVVVPVYRSVFGAGLGRGTVLKLMFTLARIQASTVRAPQLSLKGCGRV